MGAFLKVNGIWRDASTGWADLSRTGSCPSRLEQGALRSGEPKPTAGSVTIVAAHVNGYPKESHKPLWDTLLENSRSGTSKPKIRGIWIADMAHQNANVAINEGITACSTIPKICCAWWMSSAKICHCQLLASDIVWELRSRCSDRLPSATFHQLVL